MRIRERMTNEGGRGELHWGHHPAFGWPFIDETAGLTCRSVVFAPLRLYTNNLSMAPEQLTSGRGSGIAGADRSVADSGTERPQATWFSSRNHRWWYAYNTRLSVGSSALSGGCVQAIVVWRSIEVARLPGGAQPTNALEPAPRCRCCHMLRAGRSMALGQGESQEIELTQGFEGSSESAALAARDSESIAM